MGPGSKRRPAPAAASGEYRRAEQLVGVRVLSLNTRRANRTASEMEEKVRSPAGSAGGGGTFLTEVSGLCAGGAGREKQALERQSQLLTDLCATLDRRAGKEPAPADEDPGAILGASVRPRTAMPAAAGGSSLSSPGDGCPPHYRSVVSAKLACLRADEAARGAFSVRIRQLKREAAAKRAATLAAGCDMVHNNVVVMREFSVEAAVARKVIRDAQGRCRRAVAAEREVLLTARKKERGWVAAFRSELAEEERKVLALRDLRAAVQRAWLVGLCHANWFRAGSDAVTLARDVRALNAYRRRVGKVITSATASWVRGLRQRKAGVRWVEVRRYLLVCRLWVRIQRKRSAADVLRTHFRSVYPKGFRRAFQCIRYFLRAVHRLQHGERDRRALFQQIVLAQLYAVEQKGNRLLTGMCAERGVPYQSKVEAIHKLHDRQVQHLHVEIMCWREAVRFKSERAHLQRMHLVPRDETDLPRLAPPHLKMYLPRGVLENLLQVAACAAASDLQRFNKRRSPTNRVSDMYDASAKLREKLLAERLPGIPYF
ncbi:hypothetical protein DIPPA_32760 [Diplonema papillatum]|nr:hypothetical protein DIPPA_32760 [Diplonema papillatum]